MSPRASDLASFRRMALRARTYARRCKPGPSRDKHLRQASFALSFCRAIGGDLIAAGC